MASETREQAQQHVNDLRGRMERFFRGEIDEATFRAESRRHWDAIQAAPHEVEAEVLHVIRQSLPVVPEVR
jgi:hypothetical protein